MNTHIPLTGQARLTHLGVIRVRGADASKFLHSQLTSDFSMLGLSQARLAGFCSAKGRLQASFLAWKAGHDEVLLACPIGLLPATLKRLSMFVLRLQCKLSDASKELSMTGLAGAPAQSLVADLPVWGKRDEAAGWTIRLPDAAGQARCIRVSPSSPDDAAAQGAADEAVALGLADWQWLEVQSGVPWIEATTVDQFVPQMINLELLGAVDFKKGCYPGQEVVARSQYRGTLKRRMFLFDVDAAAAPGQEVYHNEDPGQPAGLVVNAAPNPIGGGNSALVEVKLAALSSGSLHLGSAQGASLQRRPLPYEMPLEQAQVA